MSKSTPRLGKGLSALIGSRTTAAAAGDLPSTAITGGPPQAAQPGERLAQIPIDELEPNPYQPRSRFDENSLAELAASVRQSGLLQPVLVRRGEGGRFQIVAGERRWRAARLAGLEAVPAIVREVGDAEALELALIENVQREDLDPLERAAAYQQLVDKAGLTIEQVAQRLGQSRANVSNYLRLLKLGDEIREMISAGQLGMGQARALVGVSNPQRQLAIARMAVRRNLSVRQVEELARRAEQPAASEPQPVSPVKKHLAELEERLSKAVGLPVRLQPGRKKNSGRIVIRYNSLEEFDRIAEMLGADSRLE